MESLQEPKGHDGDGPGRDVVIEGHRYDGIREYDNPMPGWWVWIFVASIAFAVVYVPGVHVFGFIDDYQDDLAEGLAELDARRAAFAEQGGGFEATDASLAAFMDDADAEAAGAATFATYCAACHGAEGQGLIGPNLTDEYWIHDSEPTQVFEVITTGVAAKGMPAWEGSIAAEDRARLVAFIASIAGTEPENAKAPEGEPVVE
jgi:cytochrome c oxidase cbb3-type subunit 3